VRKLKMDKSHNITEEFRRFHFQENIQFCRQSRGSIHELIDQLITSRDEGFIKDDEYVEGRKLISKALALLNGYINYLSQQKERIANNR
jgi:four helix bundle protein